MFSFDFGTFFSDRKKEFKNIDEYVTILTFEEIQS